MGSSESGEARGTDWLRGRLLEGLVIPAHPLALSESGTLDERHQRALTRYYLSAGAGGVAVGVHTTQFAIHSPEVGLYRPVLELALETSRAFEEGGKRVVRVAGIVGPLRPALREAALARDLGYDSGLVSLGGLSGASDAALIEHVREVANILPVFGFYLQPAVGGRSLGYRFWRSLAEIEQVVAIKIAPFNRYATLDVIRGVADAGRLDEIALYTGNDDNIIADLLTPFRLGTSSGELVETRIVGGLLGQWAVWTRRAVEILERVRRAVQGGAKGDEFTELMALNVQLTDANAALFDVAHAFAGCIAGIHEVLLRQGLLSSRRCLDPTEVLSTGQAEEITRVSQAYPQLIDDDFVRQHLDDWLA